MPPIKSLQLLYLLITIISSSPIIADTFRDDFNSKTYNNSDGDIDRSGNFWIESGDDGDATSGSIKVDGAAVAII